MTGMLTPGKVPVTVETRLTRGARLATADRIDGRRTGWKCRQTMRTVAIAGWRRIPASGGAGAARRVRGEAPAGRPARLDEP
jgi:hypothetical protein